MSSLYRNCWTSCEVIWNAWGSLRFQFVNGSNSEEYRWLWLISYQCDLRLVKRSDSSEFFFFSAHQIHLQRLFETQLLCISIDLIFTSDSLFVLLSIVQSLNWLFYFSSSILSLVSLRHCLIHTVNRCCLNAFATSFVKIGTKIEIPKLRMSAIDWVCLFFFRF